MKKALDNLGNRIKQYEDAYRIKLPIRMPIIVRLDGKSFHSYTKGCNKPFDLNLIDILNETAMYICKNTHDIQLAYLQSDEITFFLHNYKELNSQPYFDNNIQKIVSVMASMAGAVFTSSSHKIFGTNKLAVFDARAFIVPEKEVNNTFLFRQQDASRNSIQSLARSLYSHKQCDNKNTSELQEMTFQKGQNWNDLPTHLKRGRCVIKENYDKNGTQRSRWIVDNEIPIFSQNPEYINKYLKVNY